MKDTAAKWWRSLSINDWRALLTKHDPFYNKMESHKLTSFYVRKKYPSDDLILDIWQKENEPPAHDHEDEKKAGRFSQINHSC